MNGTPRNPAGTAPRNPGRDPSGRRLLALLARNPGGSGWKTGLATVAGVVVALALSSLLIAVTGGSPLASVRALFQGSVADWTAWTSTLLYAAPLLLVAVGACVSARSGVFNIGQEGQVLVGALFAAWVGLRLAVTGPALLVVVLTIAALAGGAWAGLSSLMYRLRGVNVVVSTLLMTFVAQQLVAFAVNTPWLLQESRVGDAVVAPQSNPLPESALLGSIGEYPDLQVNGGLLIAVTGAVVVATAIARTRWGFRLTMLGLNPLAARHAGVRVGALGGAALAVSGAFAGLAGAVLLTSPVGVHRLQPGMAMNIGWDGLLVALVARNRPVPAVLFALLFGVLRSGGGFLAATGVPPFIVDVVKVLLVLAFVAPPAVIAVIRRRETGARVAHAGHRSVPVAEGAAL
ncbi:ABC transporter permease [Streptosporangium sp. NBC_01469]|uniref:ABC transporter permease n=1 Tax=Streptosporangium sp. NBC_01469 TaxID=2903898 RepID=UPI002E2BA843|nr:ABC transporter permease [Streptosporangium sp. NBC_01469]